MNAIHNPNCDGAHCTKEYGTVRKLPAGGGANLILCRDCFAHEWEYRRERNRELSPDAQFDLPMWKDLEVYGSLYQDLKDAGVPLCNHASDLYFQRSPKSMEILANYPEQSRSAFINQAPPHAGETWIDATFAYLPFWDKVSERSNQNSAQ
jgi:hypothetical protein